MTKEKTNIELQKAGRKRPFKLPENYFDDFAVKMDKLITDNKKVTNTFRLRPWMYGTAASLIAIVFLGQIYKTNYKNEKLAMEVQDTYILSQVNESSIIDYYLTAENDK
ncbi:MAG: hypothetical protein GX361_04795 [Bacteroidales bacterium]|nr:hypothetical protein [Bacteroidales bacterium]